MTQAEHFHDSEAHGDVDVADSFTVDFCEHGYGQIALWREGDDKPFAIAYFAPKNTPDLARLFAEAMQPVGHA